MRYKDFKDDTTEKQRKTAMLITLLMCVVLFILIYLFSGCEQYRGIVKPGDIDRYISTGHFVCLEDGVATVCIKAVPVPGPQGEQGVPGMDGISIVGPVGSQGLPGEQGEQGIQGEPGRDGVDGADGRDGIDGEDGAIVVVITPYLKLETPAQSFVLEISQGIPEDEPDVYVTPVASVEVPVGGGEPIITPTADPVSVQPVTPPLPDNGEIWHVMYRTVGGQAHVYVYPRERDIQTVPPHEVSVLFLDEIQGDRDFVNQIVQEKLAEDNVPLGTIGGVQGVVNR